MKIKEIHEILQKHKNGKVTQNDIARAIGTSRANVSKLFAKNSFINDDKIKKIEEYFDINIGNISGLVYIDYYPETIAKEYKDKIIMSEKHVKSAIPMSLFPVEENSKYIMCHANDDSMEPLIFSGDFLIIKLKNPYEITNNKIHAFLYDNTFYVRRLSKNINQIVVKSENKDFPVQYIGEQEMNSFRLIGQVVYVGRTEGLL